VSLLQKPAHTPEELEASRPLDIAPEAVLELDEREWYARVYRRNAPQLTLRAIAMGTVLGFFLSFTNVYIGLKTGWFLGVNLTACILSYAIWSSLRSAGLAKSDLSILENTTVVSTTSAAGYATGLMVVSAIPAMLLLSVTEENPGGTQLPWYVIAVWIFSLASLGVVLAIPMKRNMINREKLRFPSGTAAAVTLQGLYSSGREALEKARVLFVTAALAALVPIMKELEILKKGVDAAGRVVRDTILPGQSNVFDWIGSVLPAAWTHRMLTAGGKAWKLSDFQIKLDHGVALVFAGIIVGLRVTTWMVLSGLVLAAFVTPPALEWSWTDAAGNVTAAATHPGSAWKQIGIWTGAPILVASGLVSFAAQWRTIVRAAEGLLPGREKRAAAREAAAKEQNAPPGGGAGEGPFRENAPPLSGRAPEPVDPADVEVPTRWFVSGMAVSGAAVVAVAFWAFAIPLHLGVLAVLMTFVLALVACRATGESDITPSGALGKIMQLTYGVLIPQSTTANLMTAAITSGASASSADLLNDLKTGYLLGANPRRQFLAQAAGLVTGTIGTVLCYFVLVPDATVLTGDAGNPPAFPAPSAQQWKAVAEVFKHGLENLHPMSQEAIKWGVLVGVVLALAELYAPRRVKKWLPSPTGVGLGFVLPFFYPLSMFLGAAFGAIATRLDKRWSEKYLVAIAAGGIAGESIVGVLVQAVNNFVLH
jgi:OPT family oligopeptide transporter